MSSSNTQHILSLLFSAGRAIRENAHKHGDLLTIVKLQTLRYVKEDSPLMKEVAHYLAITPPSATTLIDGLVATKMLQRHEDVSDRRRVRLRITKKGERFLEKGHREMARHTGTVVSKLNKQEQRHFIQILEKIVSSYTIK